MKVSFINGLNTGRGLQYYVDGAWIIICVYLEIHFQIFR
jgi:hypothetical protein